MITPRNSLWIVPFLLIVTFPLWKIPVGSFLAPRGGYDPKFIKKPVNQRNFTMETVNILQSEKGQKTADIRAAKAITSKLPNEYILKMVNADIIGEDGKTTNITAKSGVYNSLTRRLKLIKDVVVTNKEDGFTLTTDLLYYYDIDRKVHCPKKTQFQGDGIFITGRSFDYDVIKGFYDVGGRVFCTIQDYGTP